MSVSVRKGTTFSGQWGPPERLRRDPFDHAQGSNQLAGLARAARWLRGVAIGRPRRKRCPVEHPRDVTVELLAQRDGRLEEAQPGRRGVQIQLITT